MIHPLKKVFIAAKSCQLLMRGGKKSFKHALHHLQGWNILLESPVKEFWYATTLGRPFGKWNLVMIMRVAGQILTTYLFGWKATLRNKSR